MNRLGDVLCCREVFPEADGGQFKLTLPSFLCRAISLSLKLENIAETRRLFHKAVQFHPYHVTFWKDFLLFEVTHGSCTMVPRIQKRCQELGVEIEEFSQFLTNYSKASS